MERGERVKVWVESIWGVAVLLMLSLIVWGQFRRDTERADKDEMTQRWNEVITEILDERLRSIHDHKLETRHTSAP